MRCALIVIVCLLLCGCATLGRRYQVVILDVNSAQINRLEPQNKEDADKKSIAINMAAQGQAISWVQKRQSVTAGSPRISLPKVKAQEQ